MSRLETVNVIHLFDFYLALMLVLGLSRRYPVYWDTVRILVAVRGRWPKLLVRMRQHHGVFVSAEVLRPLAVAVGLMVVQFLCSRLIFPTAELIVRDVLGSPLAITLVLLGLVPMLFVDGYFLIFVARFDRDSAEQYMDKAEHWLASWKAPAVRVVTLGYVNPHRMVDSELQKGMMQLSDTVRVTAWWVSLQIGCRMLCGLAIWTAWALTTV